jgi:catechol 2,3-dioxygenase-like lactoylglutathione lyase family enzyme
MKSIRHIGIVVSDLKCSIHFYRDLLGLRIEKQAHESGTSLDNLLAIQNAQVTTVKLSAEQGDMMIELLQFKSPKAIPSPRSIYSIGPTHIAFTVDNLETLYERLTAAGVRFNAPPQCSPDGHAKVAFGYDPDGTPLEFVQVLASATAKKFL